MSAEITNFNSSKPPGLILINDFITVEEEKLLLESFTNLTDATPNNDLKHRTVIHFGFKFDYNTNRADVSKPLIDKPIPKLYSDLLLKLEQQTGKDIYSLFNQLTVNIYQPGDGIPPHTDTHSAFTDEIVSISLNSDIVMDWTNPISQEELHVDLKARSACIMTNEARYLWKHAIAARKSDLIFHSSSDEKKNHFEKRQRSLRISLTFRKVAPALSKCCCAWPLSCDTAPQRDETAAFRPDQPAKLEAEFVHSVYDSIADHFSDTRHSMWPRVRFFIERQPRGSIGADIGCGNGKYFPAILSRGALLATDSSGNLCRIAADRHRVDAVQSNCLQLPYRAGCCDYFVCIAVLHHLSTAERRLQAMERMATVLRQGGQGLIYVWSQDQQRDGQKSKYIDKGAVATQRGVIREVQSREHQRNGEESSGTNKGVGEVTQVREHQRNIEESSGMDKGVGEVTQVREHQRDGGKSSDTHKGVHSEVGDVTQVREHQRNSEASSGTNKGVGEVTQVREHQRNSEESSGTHMGVGEVTQVREVRANGDASKSIDILPDESMRMEELSKCLEKSIYNDKRVGEFARSHGQQSSEDKLKCTDKTADEALNGVVELAHPQKQHRSEDNRATGDSIQPLPVHMNRTQFSSTDMLVPWCKRQKQEIRGDSSASGGTPQVFTRYYHLFQQDELQQLCASVPGLRVMESWYDSGNWAVVVEKV